VRRGWRSFAFLDLGMEVDLVDVVLVSERATNQIAIEKGKTRTNNVWLVGDKAGTKHFL
jgi:hypothetical protein